MTLYKFIFIEIFVVLFNSYMYMVTANTVIVNSSLQQNDFHFLLGIMNYVYNELCPQQFIPYSFKTYYKLIGYNELCL